MSSGESVRGRVEGEALAVNGWRTLPFEVLQALRAGSMLIEFNNFNNLGRFGHEAVARLLGVPPMAVLERLQHAIDAGVPVTESEAGFTLDEAWRAELVGSLMPSLARAWRSALAQDAVKLSDGAGAAEARAGADAGAEEGTEARATAEAGVARAGAASRAAGRAGQACAADDVAGEAAGGVQEQVSAGTGAAGGAAPEAGAARTDTDARGAGGGGGERDEGGAGGADEPVGSDDGKVSAGTGVEAASEVSEGTEAAPEVSAVAEAAGEVFEGTEGVAAAGEVSEGTEGVVAAGEVSEGTDGAAVNEVSGVAAGEGEVPGGTGAVTRPGASEGTMEIDAAMLLQIEVRGPRAERGPPPPPAAEGTMEIDASMVVQAEPKAATSAASEARPRGAGKREQVMPRLEDTGMGALHLDFLIAAQEAEERGAPQAAAEHLQRALGELASQSPAHKRLRILGLIALAKVQWRSAGAEHGFTLSEAMSTLDAARAELGADAPSDLAAELCQTIAGVCFDLGDMPSLERALAELAVASRLFEAAGDAARVARLLNERAAVLVLLGDAGQAATMLKASRKAFEGREDDPTAQREIAETDHMMAWLSLYAQLRPGRELDGLRMGLEHAKAAERIFNKLGDGRELARTQETMGRLALRLEQPGQAIAHLEPAVARQRELGDLIGLGRSTDALAQALALVGRESEAIAVLAESIATHREKGSPLGLAFNRQTFTNFAVRLGASLQGAALHEVGLLLARVERELDVIRKQAVR